MDKITVRILVATDEADAKRLIAEPGDFYVLNGNTVSGNAVLYAHPHTYRETKRVIDPPYPSITENSEYEAYPMGDPIDVVLEEFRSRFNVIST